MKRLTWFRVYCATIVVLLLSSNLDAASYGPVVSTVDTNRTNVQSPISLAAINGFPAITYYDQNNNRIVFAINDQQDGSGNWTLNSVVVAVVPDSLKLLNTSGNLPFIIVRNSGNITTFSSSSTLGVTSSWTPNSVPLPEAAIHVSAAIVNGFPAVSIATVNASATNYTLRYGINSNAQGTSTWTLNTVATGISSSLAVISGKPAILYDNNNSVAYFATNSASNGLGTWSSNNANVSCYGDAPALAELNGVPVGLSRGVDGIIRHMVATDASGSNWIAGNVDSGPLGTDLFVTIVSGRAGLGYRRTNPGPSPSLDLAVNTTLNATGPFEFHNINAQRYVLNADVAVIANRPAAAMFHFLNGTGNVSFVRSPAPVVTPQSVDVAKGTAKNFTVSGSSTQGNALTFRALANGSLGLIAGTSPNFTYTPIGNGYGPDQAPFVANDGLGEGQSSQISFTLFNGPEKTWIVENTDSTGPGSLNFMMQLSKSGHSIKFDPNVFDLGNSDAATVISLNTALPSMTEGSVIIDATDRRVTVNGSGAGSTDGFYIASDSNVIQGLAIVGFERSGINIVGAKNNIIGGSRAVGANPNGQGLRISNCGSFGIQMSAAASGNVVKGCWIGLSPSGNAPDPNLAGILIKDGSTQNIIGSTDVSEANAISGNTFEAIVVSDSGSDGNQIIGNVVGLGGASAAISAASRIAGEDILPTRAAVANGSSGVFISRGTRGTMVGGTQKESGNVIARNGGSGVEVRVQNTIENSATSNQITLNTRGGISLFDGSNNNVQAPQFAAVSRAADDPGIAGRAMVNVSGTALAASGVVELFSDVGNQGGTLVGRIAVTGNVWSGVVDVSDLENITATFTDDAGNTSPFAVFGRAPDLSGGSGIGGGTSLDSDKDGVADILETLAGTNAFSAVEVPIKETSVVGVDRLMLSLRFDKTSLDSLSGTYRIALPVGFAAANASVGVQFGGYAVRETLDENGRAAKGAVIRIRVGRDNAGALLLFKARKADLRLALAANGLTDKTTPKEGQTGKIPAAVGLSSGGTNRVYVGEAEVTYKSTQGKSGKAKLVRKK